MTKTLIIASLLAVALTACNKSDETAAPAGTTAPSTTAPAAPSGTLGGDAPATPAPNETTAPK